MSKVLIVGRDCFAPDGAGSHRLLNVDETYNIAEPVASHLVRSGAALYLDACDVPKDMQPEQKALLASPRALRAAANSAEYRKRTMVGAAVRL